MTDTKEIEQDTQELPQEPEPSSFKLIITLAIAGLLSGVVLVGTYVFTLPIIKENKRLALEGAIFEVLEDCKSFTPLYDQGGKLVEADAVDPKDIEKDIVPKVFMGYNEAEEFVGFAIPGAQAGFQDIIGVIYGYDPTERKIIGFKVLESKETPGLGDKIFKDMPFQENFKALKVDPNIVIVKNGGKTNNNEVESITGATISSKAIVTLLNNSMDHWKEMIDAYVKDNNLEVAQ